jgi:putative 4-mercaptohistidine N1-methyltranferase
VSRREEKTVAENPYETQELLAQYLLFHFGSEANQLPHEGGPREALNYPVRCISECLDASRLPEGARALDLGCSVGRSTFELARHCREAIGIDYSQAFIDAANDMKEHGEVGFAIHEEGPSYRSLNASLPSDIDRSRVSFETGDACDLRDHLGAFDAVLMANLIDRLPEPTACLERLPGLCNPGAQLIITSPYTWMAEYTPEENWLCREGQDTLEGLKEHLEKDFTLQTVKDLPFLIREHRRKYQWSCAQASVWIRK